MTARAKDFSLDLTPLHFQFTSKPLLIGGKAMEYYGLRRAGNDIDLIVTGQDYQRLASLYADRRKDLWGDLGVCPMNFEIWRTVALFDYDYWSDGAILEDDFQAISLDRLLFSRVLAMHIDKYRRDLGLVRDAILQQHLADRVKYLPHGCLGQFVVHADLVCVATIVRQDGEASVACLKEIWAGEADHASGSSIRVRLPAAAAVGQSYLLLLTRVENDKYRPLGEGVAQVAGDLLCHAQPDSAIGREIHQQPVSAVKRKVEAAAKAPR